MPCVVFWKVFYYRNRWGVNEEIKKKGQWFADHLNAVAVVPDLYRGKATDDREEAGHLMSGLDFPGAVQDIAGVAKDLIEKPEYGVTKVGCLGFCMGGALSLAAALNAPNISAAAPFYGIPGADLSKIKVPVQGHFGNLDAHKGFSDPETVNKLEESLKASGVTYEIHRYENCDHAFTKFDGANYKEAEAKVALQRTVEFLKKHLQ